MEQVGERKTYKERVGKRIRLMVQRIDGQVDRYADRREEGEKSY